MRKPTDASLPALLEPTSILMLLTVSLAEQTASSAPLLTNANSAKKTRQLFLEPQTAFPTVHQEPISIRKPKLLSASHVMKTVLSALDLLKTTVQYAPMDSLCSIKTLLK